eukprot:gene3510-4414_t
MSSIGLRNVGIFRTSLHHPTTYGEWLLAPNAPTALIYGHYDVQPVDPLDLWDSDPFKCERRDGVYTGRGVADDKAVLSATGTLPINVKVLIEGAEEIGSPGMKGWIEAHKEMLKCDFVISADGSQVAVDQPGLVLGLRGMASMGFTLTTASTDLHSGLFGGAVQNPLRAMAQLISSLHSPQGKIQIVWDGGLEVAQVDGFLDDVKDLSASELVDYKRFEELVDVKGELAKVGVDEPFGEEGHSILEQRWSRPTIEVVGMWGGFMGDGIKTVLPREAHAKLAMRLVPYQKVELVTDAVKQHLMSFLPPSCNLTFDFVSKGSEAYLANKDGYWMAAASATLKHVMGAEPVYYRMGGSIPAVAHFKEILDVDTIFMAFDVPDQNIHAPNEFMREGLYEMAHEAFAHLLFEVKAAYAETVPTTERAEL